MMPALANAGKKIDSLRKVITTLKGEERLEALSELSDHVKNYGDSKYELKVYRQMREEAKRQKSRVDEDDAVFKQVAFYYDRSMKKEFERFLPEALAYYEMREAWDYYYHVMALKVEYAQFCGNIQQAMIEAMKMGADAQRRNNILGMGITNMTIGNIYYSDWMDVEQSIKHLEKAIRLIEESDNGKYEVFMAYLCYCDILLDVKDYKKLKAVVAEWEKALADYVKEKKFSEEDLRGDYIYLYIYKAFGYMYNDNMIEARKYINKADGLIGERVVYKNHYYYCIGNYYMLSGKTNDAIDVYSKLEIVELEIGDSVGWIEALNMKGKALMKAGRNDEASALFKKVIDTKDLIYGSSTRRQINEFNTLYHVNELKYQSRIYCNRMYAAVAVCLVLLLIVVIHIIYLQRLHKKNNALYVALKTKENAEKRFEEQITDVPADMLSAEQQLFKRITELMNVEKVFLNEELNRNILASMLGTNSLYVANSIKACAGGISVNDFINRCRLRYAAAMLVRESDKPVSLIGDESGFSSRATFSRQFRDFFGMSASEYRRIAREEMVKTKYEDGI